MDFRNLFDQADLAYDTGDIKVAFDLFLKAAKSGDSSAMGRVAVMDNGQKNKKNKTPISSSEMNNIYASRFI